MQLLEVCFILANCDFLYNNQPVPVKSLNIDSDIYYLEIIIICWEYNCGLGSSVDIATGYRLDGLEIESQ
jgi:hypothetical protein